MKAPPIEKVNNNHTHYLQLGEDDEDEETIDDQNVIKNTQYVRKKDQKLCWEYIILMCEN